MADPLSVVRAWQAAITAADVEAALALSAPDIFVGGPRGSGRGPQLVRDWVARTGLTLEELALYPANGCVIAEQRATWNLPNGTASTRLIATVFVVSDDRVTSVVRYDSVDDALAAAGK
jgi:hypothetical protein